MDQPDSNNSVISDMDLIGSNFSGEMITYMRESLGLSLRGFARFLDMEVSHQTISNWENEICEPSKDTYARCVTKYVEKKNNTKLNPAKILLLNPLTVQYLKGLISQLSKKEKQALFEKINDGED
ncbi:helix-turn-helix domain-containing protein [Pseudoalteromonas galatheae]|uniref:helix-turn-helix domain-containing protein n=1 Tax=Pseudoalteromonas galatheae TaxID=579562 RepID=UPI0030D37620